MENGIHLIILTPGRKLVDVQSVDEIYLKTGMGMMSIMPGYAPIITDLDIGIITYTKGNTSGILKVSGGLAQMEENNKMTIFADIAEDASQIDLPRAQKALERAEALLLLELSDNDRKRAMESKRKALARIEAVEFYNQQKKS